MIYSVRPGREEAAVKGRGEPKKDAASKKKGKSVKEKRKAKKEKRAAKGY